MAREAIRRSRNLSAQYLSQATYLRCRPNRNPNSFERDWACYLQRITAIAFSQAKEHKITRRQVIKLLDTSGVTRFSTFQVGFDPVGEQVFVNTLRVTDSEGREIAVGKPSDYYVIDAADDNVATQQKILNVPVPGLQPGHTVEFVVTVRDLVETPHFPYFDHAFVAEIPLIKDVVYVDAAGGMYAGYATHDLSSVPAGAARRGLSRIRRS